MNLLVAIIVSMSFLGLSSCVSSQVSVPDYSTWKSDSVVISCLHNDKQTFLVVMAYNYMAKDYLSGAGIIVYNDEKIDAPYCYVEGGRGTDRHGRVRI